MCSSEKKVMNKRHKASTRGIRIFYFLFSIFFSLSVNAQCAMCRAALAGEGNKVKAQAVNDGIVYLMVIPYLLVAGIGYAIYRMKKKK
jgi:hypothetical protein